jgi:hypothetical protein
MQRYWKKKGIICKKNAEELVKENSDNWERFGGLNDLKMEEEFVE